MTAPGDPIDEVLTAFRGGRSKQIKQQVVAHLAAMSARDRELLLICATLPHAWNVEPVAWLIGFLLGKGVSPDVKTNGTHTYPLPKGIPLAHALMRSMKRRHNDRAIENAVISFVEAGANLGPIKPARRTLLHEAAGHGSTTLMTVLLRHRADIETRDKNGETPLFDAARSDSVAALKMLLDAGAANALNKHDETAHDIAVAEGARKTAAILATTFPSERELVGGALTNDDVERLLARVAKARHSIVAPSGKPDPAFEKVFARGRVHNKRIYLELDRKALPKLSPTIRKELLTALGHEGLRWLTSANIETRAYSVGAVQPWYMIPAKSVKRAEKLLASR